MDVESPRAAGEHAGAHLGLRQRRRAAVEPFVEVQLEPVLGQLDVGQAGASERVGQLAGREVPLVRSGDAIL